MNTSNTPQNETHRLPTGSPLGKTSRNRLSSQVADRIMSDVIARGLQPGDQLETEPALVERYDVSRSVIREAGRILDERGLVDIRPGRGMTVAAFDGSGIAKQYELMLELNKGSFEQLMEMRLVLEVGISELAAVNHTEEDATLIQAALDGYNSSSEDSREVLEWDLAFHRAIAAASQNPFFVHSVDPINDYLRKTYERSMGYAAAQEATNREHHEIANAIFARDKDLAAKATRNHLTRVRDDSGTLARRQPQN